MSMNVTVEECKLGDREHLVWKHKETGDIVVKTGAGDEDKFMAGIVMKSKHVLFGYASDSWLRDEFTPFYGTITIEVKP